jgi:hypothetical protein
LTLRRRLEQVQIPCQPMILGWIGQMGVPCERPECSLPNGFCTQADAYGQTVSAGVEEDPRVGQQEQTAKD